MDPSKKSMDVERFCRLGYIVGLQQHIIFSLIHELNLPKLKAPIQYKVWNITYSTFFFPRWNLITKNPYFRSMYYIILPSSTSMTSSWLVKTTKWQTSTNQRTLTLQTVPSVEEQKEEEEILFILNKNILLHSFTLASNIFELLNEKIVNFWRIWLVHDFPFIIFPFNVFPANGTSSTLLFPSFFNPNFFLV